MGTYVSHPSFNGNEGIYVAKHLCAVQSKGDPSGFFDVVDQENTTVQYDPDDEEHEEIDPAIFHASNQAEDIAIVRSQGFIIYYDNDPGLEKIRAHPDAENLYPRQTWGVQTHVDKMEIHGSTQSTSFIGEFDVKGATWL